MKNRLLAFLVSSSLLCAAGAATLQSPGGKFTVETTLGKNVKGSDVMPISARLTPNAGGPPINLVFKLIRYSEPTDITLGQAFIWSADESAVAVENTLRIGGFGYLLVPLKPGLPWKPLEIEAKEIRWIDENRLVFRGNGSERTYLGIFDARTGKSRIANDNLTRFTSYEITAITPNTVSFHETTDYENNEHCYSFNTQTGKRTAFKCGR